MARGRMATPSCDLAPTTAVRVLVHDVSGRLRRILTVGEHPAGYLEIGWDPSDAQGRRLPAGFYFLRLEGAAAPPVRVVLLR